MRDAYLLHYTPIMKYLFSFFAALILTATNIKADDNASGDAIIGKWMASTKDLTVEVYPYKNTYRAKIVWFSGGVSKDKPMETIVDKNNPNPSLRTRKVLGLDVVENITYKPKSKTYEGGKIYEVQSGKSWDAYAYIENTGQLKVKGYWHVKFLGRTLTFNRVK
ncbi:DUF2147 domain-containing protein [Mucilaginibacter pallidiroseus]|uniref:DUF2147 domain-containing protein n=2 Tax=Mucilaginibacter pallidiroseus TaxID=2599295 RepID=A0A563U358_9SPHI|nr:DUF2147 domain-containing protein [Mucilaginibacter pallidiroseus]